MTERITDVPEVSSTVVLVHSFVKMQYDHDCIITLTTFWDVDGGDEADIVPNLYPNDDS